MREQKNISLPPEFVKEVEDFKLYNKIPSFSEAVRILVEKGMGTIHKVPPENNLFFLENLKERIRMMAIACGEINVRTAFFIFRDKDNIPPLSPYDPVIVTHERIYFYFDYIASSYKNFKREGDTLIWLGLQEE